MQLRGREIVRQDDDTILDVKENVGDTGNKEICQDDGDYDEEEHDEDENAEDEDENDQENNGNDKEENDEDDDEDENDEEKNGNDKEENDEDDDDQMDRYPNQNHNHNYRDRIYYDDGTYDRLGPNELDNDRDKENGSADDC